VEKGEGVGVCWRYSAVGVVDAGREGQWADDHKQHKSVILSTLNYRVTLPPSPTKMGLDTQRHQHRPRPEAMQDSTHSPLSPPSFSIHSPLQLSSEVILLHDRGIVFPKCRDVFSFDSCTVFRVEIVLVELQHPTERE
jgi:hypothetical protein